MTTLLQRVEAACGLMFRATHERLMLKAKRHHDAELSAAYGEFADTISDRDVEIVNLRRETVGLRNQISELTGKLMIKRHGLRSIEDQPDE